MFELFTTHSVREEVRGMLLALKDADYAISDLTKEQILEHATHFGKLVELRKLRDGRVKVTLQQHLNKADHEEATQS